MRRKDQGRLRLVAWACVLVLLVAAASPAGSAAPAAILAPPAPILGEAGACFTRPVEETPPPNLVLARGVPARAPPLA